MLAGGICHATFIRWFHSDLMEKGRNPKIMKLSDSKMGGRLTPLQSLALRLYLQVPRELGRVIMTVMFSLAKKGLQKDLVFCPYWRLLDSQPSFGFKALWHHLHPIPFCALLFNSSCSSL